MHFIQVTAPFCRLLRSIRFARALRSIRIVRLFRYIGALRTLALSILSTMVGNWDFFCLDIDRDLGQVSPNEHIQRESKRKKKHMIRQFAKTFSWFGFRCIDILLACLLAESNRVLLFFWFYSLFLPRTMRDNDICTV